MYLKTPDNPKNPTYEELLELWDELTILPDHFSLRMINYKDGTHVLVRASSKGLSDEIHLVLSRPMTTNEMYEPRMIFMMNLFSFLNKRWDCQAAEKQCSCLRIDHGFELSRGRNAGWLSGRPPWSLQALLGAQSWTVSTGMTKLKHPGGYLTGSYLSSTGLPQAKSFPIHLLSPRDESNKGQARKKERIDLRLRDGSDSDDLPRVIDAGGFV